MEDTKRIYVRAAANGFMVELGDFAYNETTYVFTDWDEVVACVKANQPVLEKFDNSTPKAIEATSI